MFSCTSKRGLYYLTKHLEIVFMHVRTKQKNTTNSITFERDVFSTACIYRDLTKVAVAKE